MGKLVLFLADGTTLDIPLARDRVSIGRRAGNDVCLPYPAVSGEHAVVVPVTAGAVIEDLGSTNGVFVNDKRVPRQFLHDGDRIDIGRQKLVYLSDLNAVAGPPPHREPGTPAIDSRDLEIARSDEPTRVINVVDNIILSEPVSMVSAGSDASAMLAASDEPDLGAVLRPMLNVVSGPNAGRKLALTKDETLVGRVGIQVAAVRKVDAGFRLLPVEGAVPPQLNGVPVPPEGSMLKSGDVAEVAGTRVEFTNPEHAQELANPYRPSQ